MFAIYVPIYGLNLAIITNLLSVVFFNRPRCVSLYLIPWSVFTQNLNAPVNFCSPCQATSPESIIWEWVCITRHKDVTIGAEDYSCSSELSVIWREINLLVKTWLITRGYKHNNQWKWHKQKSQKSKMNDRKLKENWLVQTENE